MTGPAATPEVRLAQWLGRARKALLGLLIPAAATITFALDDHSPGGSHVTAREWLLIAVAALATPAGVYAAQNTAPPVEPDPPARPPMEWYPAPPILPPADPPAPQPVDPPQPPAAVLSPEGYAQALGVPYDPEARPT